MIASKVQNGGQLPFLGSLQSASSPPSGWPGRRWRSICIRSLVPKSASPGDVPIGWAACCTSLCVRWRCCANRCQRDNQLSTVSGAEIPWNLNAYIPFIRKGRTGEWEADLLPRAPTVRNESGREGSWCGSSLSSSLSVTEKSIKDIHKRAYV